MTRFQGNQETQGNGRKKSICHIYIHMSHSISNWPAVTLSIFDFFPRKILKSVSKKYRTRSVKFLKKIFGSIALKIT